MATRIPRVLGLTTVALAFAVTPPAQAATPVHYTVTFIGAKSLPFGNEPFALNAAGHTAGLGTFRGSSGETGYLATGPTQLAGLPGLVTSDPGLATATEAFGINDNDTVVGAAQLNFPIRQDAVVWRDGKPADLAIPLPGDEEVRAVAINDAGQIAGSGLDTGKAWLYQNGTTTILPALPGGQVAEAFGITQDGQVLGVASATADTSHAEAVAWRGGAVVPLGSLPGSTWSEAHAMNQAGVAVGAAGFNGDEFAPHHPVLFAHGQVTDLWPDLGGSTSGTAFAVNATGTVVGDGRDGWVYRDGVRTDLDRLIPADAGVTITAAWAINDAGQIAATAHLKNGTTTQRTPDYAVLLTPVTG
ncbi:hypothetical protein OG738_31125 [Amycolatopsis sp. NBC_01488]|uniref:hypothetical protein n=1 Tax=Amycolatopsis sp. NBC_01488 TaxID=2903563 RepID=UPI002E2E3BAF|nr:hypothetical protein [Amycolatopsis sp. NBC_01488]